MSSAITQCCGAPAQSVQQQPPAVTGGGPNVDPGAQAPAPTMCGGGSTSYDAQPNVAGSGTYVPAPTADGDVPPDPIAVPGTTATPAPDSATPGTTAPSTPGSAAPGSTNADPAAGTTSPWTPQWEQKFLALGLPQELVAQLKQQAIASGADEAKIAAVYEQMAAQVVGGGAISPGATSGTTPQTGAGAADPQAPGWNPQIEAAFRKLGMPDELIKIYAESGAPIGGLEVAYKHASDRMEDFKKRGWYDKFVAAKVSSNLMWSAILAPKPESDKNLAKFLQSVNGSKRSTKAKALQLTTSLIPGGRLAQYARGKETTGDKIDRSSKLEMAGAALSGVAALVALRGGKTLGASWAARSGNYAELTKLSTTLHGLPGGGPKLGASGVTDAGLGSLQNWTAKTKLLSALPYTRQNRELLGLGQAHAAAKALNNGGAAKLMSDPDGALQIATASQVLSDVMSGTTRMRVKGNVFLPSLMSKGAPITRSVTKDGEEVFTVRKNLHIGNGNSQLVSLLEAGGTKLGTQPEWLSTAPSFVDDVTNLAKVERESIGANMAGNAARNLGGFSRDGFRSTRYLNKLSMHGDPQWYKQLAGHTAREWRGGTAGVAAPTAASASTAARTTAPESLDAFLARVRGTGANGAHTPAPAPQLHVGANGEVTTSSGLIVPSYASPVSGIVPEETVASGEFMDLFSKLRQV